MKKFTIILLSLSFLLCFISCKKEVDWSKNGYLSKYKKEINDCRKKLGIYLLTNDVPGMSVAVMHNNQLIWSEGVGFANKELDVVVTPYTKFRIGGGSKLFTGALLAKLSEDGKIDLTKNVRDYIPELPEDKAQINFLHLAGQMSGIRSPSNKEFLNSGYSTVENGMSVFVNDSLFYPTGEFIYESDFNYDLLGAALEKISGERFSKLLSNKLTDTLHLSSTVADDPVFIIPDRSDCYDRTLMAQLVRAASIDNRHRMASSGLLSSSLDMATLMNEYLFPKYLKKETVDKILEPIAMNNGDPGKYGLGPIISFDTKHQPVYICFGTTMGGSSCVVAYPNQKLVIAMVCNISNEYDKLPVFEISDILLKRIAPDIYDKREVEVHEKESPQPDNGK